MALDFDCRVPTRPGQETVGSVTDRMRIAPSEGFFGYMPRNDYARAKQCIALGSQFSGPGYLSTDEVQQIVGASITPGAGGLVFTTAADTVEIFSRSARTVVPAAGQYWKAVARIASTTAATCGFIFGFATVDTSPIASDPTDMMCIRCPSNSAALTARVKGNNGTAADLTSFQTTARSIAAGTPTAVSLVDVTDMEIGVEAYIGSTDALSWGNWWINGFATPFTSAQVTALRDMVDTTPLALSRYIGLLPEGSARVVTVQYCFAQVTR